MRQHILEIAKFAIEAVKGQELVASYLRQYPITDEVAVIAVGKAASSMAKGALDTLGDKVTTALVITKQNHCEPLPFTCIEAAHPIPDKSSLQAGAKLIDFVHSLPRHVQVLFLLSGGASALVEVLPDNMTLTLLRDLNKKLISSNLSIDQINQIRQQNSLIKGGKLAHYFNEQIITQLIISDVPNNNIAEIGSGLLCNHAATIIGSINLAMQAAAKHAATLNLPYKIHLNLLNCSTEIAVTHILASLQQQPNICHIFGGETTLALPADPGQGGRNQHLALLVASEIAQYQEACLLSLGTDGTDGPTEYAGALVDQNSITRGMASGLTAINCLAQANSTAFLQASGDLIKTGPTGTNVMDLIIAIRTCN